MELLALPYKDAAGKINHICMVLTYQNDLYQEKLGKLGKN